MGVLKEDESEDCLKEPPKPAFLEKLIAQKVFCQNNIGTPSLDTQRGTFLLVEEKKDELISTEVNGSVHHSRPQKKMLQLFTEVDAFNAHKRLRAIVVDPYRKWIYSVGEEDHTMIVFDFSSKQIIQNIKTQNATITCMSIDHQLRRLYCASREGMLLFFDISEPMPQHVHSMRMILPQSLG